MLRYRELFLLRSSDSLSSSLSLGESDLSDCRSELSSQSDNLESLEVGQLSSSFVSSELLGLLGCSPSLIQLEFFDCLPLIKVNYLRAPALRFLFTVLRRNLVTSTLFSGTTCLSTPEVGPSTRIFSQVQAYGAVVDDIENNGDLAGARTEVNVDNSADLYE